MDTSVTVTGLLPGSSYVIRYRNPGGVTSILTPAIEADASGALYATVDILATGTVGLGAVYVTPDESDSGLGASSPLRIESDAEVEETPPPADSPEISRQDLEDKSRAEIRRLAEERGLVPKGVPDPQDGGTRKWSDPVTNKERPRLDRGHKDPATGEPYSNPRAAVDHVHGYGPRGRTQPIKDATGEKHLPTTGP